MNKGQCMVNQILEDNRLVKEAKNYQNKLKYLELSLLGTQHIFPDLYRLLCLTHIYVLKVV